jgi:hypothetical protein
MSQISEKSIKGQIIEVVRDRYKKFEDAQEIHLEGKEFKDLLGEIGHSSFDGLEPDLSSPIFMNTWYGRIKICNRDTVGNFAEREMY